MVKPPTIHPQSDTTFGMGAWFPNRPSGYVAPAGPGAVGHQDVAWIGGIQAAACPACLQVR
jgi:hypothetical protein